MPEHTDTASRRTPRLLAAAVALVGAGSVAGAVVLSARTAPTHAAALPAPSITTHNTKPGDFPYFACVAYGNWGICIGPPTN